MSPMTDNAQDRLIRFPRVSGDEPVSVCADSSSVPFSPRERG